MGETTRAMTLMLESIQKSGVQEFKEIYNDICILSNSLNQVKRNKRLGTLKNEEESQEYNRINKSLIELISSFENQLDASGISYNQNNINVSNIPRKGVSNKLYYGFLIVGFSTGTVCGIIFMILYYHYLMKPSNQIEELLFLGSLGTTGSMFLAGAFDGLNRRKNRLIDWKIILPHVIISLLFLILAGIHSLLN